MNWKDILERAFWTFLEGFLITLPATFSIEMDGRAWKAAILAACMAGLSALKTLLLEVTRRHLEDAQAHKDSEPESRDE